MIGAEDTAPGGVFSEPEGIRRVWWGWAAPHMGHPCSMASPRYFRHSAGTLVPIGYAQFGCFQRILRTSLRRGGRGERRGYLHVAPWALAVLDAPEVHSVQGGPGALVGLGYRPGPVHPEDHANKCQRDPGAVERFPPQCRAPGEGPAWALVGRKWWRDGDEAAVVPTCRDWWRQGDGQDTRPPRGGSSREDLLPEQLAPG